MTDIHLSQDCGWLLFSFRTRYSSLLLMGSAFLGTLLPLDEGRTVQGVTLPVGQEKNLLMNRFDRAQKYGWSNPRIEWLSVTLPQHTRAFLPVWSICLLYHQRVLIDTVICVGKEQPEHMSAKRIVMMPGDVNVVLCDLEYPTRTTG